MKKILNEWKKYLNEFKMPDELPADTIISAKQAQAQIQKEIDKNSKFHASGREINPVFLKGTLKEADAVGLINSSQDVKELRNALKNLIYFDGEKIDFGIRIVEILKLLKDREEFDDLAVRKAEYLLSEIVQVKELIFELKHNLEIFHQFAVMLENSLFYNTLKSIALFTGHSVNTVREPVSFDPAKAQTHKGIFGTIRHNNYFAENEDTDYFTIDFLSDTIAEDREDYFSLFRGIFGGNLGNINYEALKPLASSEDMKKIISVLNDSELKSKFANVVEIGNPTPTAQNYKTANVIMTNLAQMPHKKEESPYTIFRAMDLPSSAVSSLKEAIDSGEQTQFNFHAISSWTTNLNTALEFLEVFDKEGEIVPTVFKVYGPTHGIYLGMVSAYPHENEFVSGGALKVVSVEWDEQNNFWFIMCKFN